mmetsp:Transcript_1634/g.4908  ORF Transcript_1634/g.4908 Transcript_1634/m.4908 type:complete len:268 (+) Transcript_1634:109-912(+)
MYAQQECSQELGDVHVEELVLVLLDVGGSLLHLVLEHGHESHLASPVCDVRCIIHDLSLAIDAFHLVEDVLGLLVVVLLRSLCSLLPLSESLTLASLGLLDAVQPVHAVDVVPVQLLEALELLENSVDLNEVFLHLEVNLSSRQAQILVAVVLANGFAGICTSLEDATVIIVVWVDVDKVFKLLLHLSVHFLPLHLGDDDAPGALLQCTRDIEKLLRVLLNLRVAERCRTRYLALHLPPQARDHGDKLQLSTHYLLPRLETDLNNRT